MQIIAIQNTNNFQKLEKPSSNTVSMHLGLTTELLHRLGIIPNRYMNIKNTNTPQIPIKNIIILSNL